MKRITFAVLLGVILLAVLAVPVLATYYASLQIVESDSNSYDMLAMQYSLDIDYLADNGYISSTGLDTRVITGSGTAVPHLLVDDRLMFASAIEADTTYNYQFTTGGTALSNFQVIPGDGGYVTTSDHANLEPGNDFEIEFDGYVNTGASAEQVEKEHAFVVFTDGEGDIHGAIYGTSTSIEQTVTFDDRSLYSGSRTRAGQRIDNFAEGSVTQLSFKLSKQGTPTGTAYVRIRRVSDDAIVGTLGSIDVSTLDGTPTWHDFTTEVYNPVTQNLRFLIEFTGGSVFNDLEVDWEDADRCTGVETYYDGSWTDNSGYDSTFKLYWVPVDVSVSATVAAGEHTVNVWADGSDLGIDIDSSTEDTEALGGASVPDNANDWVLSPVYWDYYTHTTSDTLRATYQPDAIIVGTTLPNEESPGTYDGTITWGSNPSGIAVSMDVLVSSSQLFPTPGTAEFPAPDVAGETGQPGWTDGISTNLTDNPFDPLVQVVSTETEFPVSVVWRLGATLIVAFAMILCFKYMPHQLITVAVGGGLVAFFVGMGIYPFFVVYIYACVGIAVIIYERVVQV